MKSCDMMTTRPSAAWWHTHDHDKTVCVHKCSMITYMSSDAVHHEQTWYKKNY